MFNKVFNDYKKVSVQKVLRRPLSRAQGTGQGALKKLSFGEAFLRQIGLFFGKYRPFWIRHLGLGPVPPPRSEIQQPLKIGSLPFQPR